MAIWERLRNDEQGGADMYCPRPFNMSISADDFDAVEPMQLRHEFRMVIVDSVVMREAPKIQGIAPIQSTVEQKHDPVFYCIHCRWPLFQLVRVPPADEAGKGAEGSA